MRQQYEAEIANSQKATPEAKDLRGVLIARIMMGKYIV
jgi:hypothetical protein